MRMTGRATLLYRDAHQFAVGHTCSATWMAPSDDRTAQRITTEWIPTVEVESVKAEGHAVFEELDRGEGQPLDAVWLSEADDLSLGRALLRLPATYRKWLAANEARVAGLATPQPSANRHGGTWTSARRWPCVLKPARDESLQDANLAVAFRLANKAMVVQRLWAQGQPLH